MNKVTPQSVSFNGALYSQHNKLLHQTSEAEDKKMLQEWTRVVQSTLFQKDAVIKGDKVTFRLLERQGSEEFTISVSESKTAAGKSLCISKKGGTKHRMTNYTIKGPSKPDQIAGSLEGLFDNFVKAFEEGKSAIREQLLPLPGGCFKNKNKPE